MTNVPPLSDAQRDSLIRTLDKQVDDAHTVIGQLQDVIRELRAELVAVHAQLARVRGEVEARS